MQGQIPCPLTTVSDKWTGLDSYIAKRLTGKSHVHLGLSYFSSLANPLDYDGERHSTNE
jgi:hypothetical protein